jgi:hypothetical protein
MGEFSFGEILSLTFTLLILQRAVVPDLDENTSFFVVYDGHGGLI